MVFTHPSNVTLSLCVPAILADASLPAAPCGGKFSSPISTTETDAETALRVMDSDFGTDKAVEEFEEDENSFPISAAPAYSSDDETLQSHPSLIGVTFTAQQQGDQINATVPFRVFLQASSVTAAQSVAVSVYILYFPISTPYVLTILLVRNCGHSAILCASAAGQACPSRLLIAEVTFSELELEIGITSSLRRSQDDWFWRAKLFPAPRFDWGRDVSVTNSIFILWPPAKFHFPRFSLSASLVDRIFVLWLTPNLPRISLPASTSEPRAP